jgi:hypothetical protein
MRGQLSVKEANGMTSDTRAVIEQIMAAVRHGDLSAWAGLERLTDLGMVPKIAGILIRQAQITQG